MELEVSLTKLSGAPSMVKVPVIVVVVPAAKVRVAPGKVTIRLQTVISRSMKRLEVKGFGLEAMETVSNLVGTVPVSQLSGSDQKLVKPCPVQNGSRSKLVRFPADELCMALSGGPRIFTALAIKAN